MAKELTLAEVKKRIKGLDSATQKATVCALVGHSLIVDTCFGYIHCGRCEAQIADKLTSVFIGAPYCVQIGHNCKTCRANYKKLDWRHKFLTPDPFKAKVAA